MAPRFLWRSLVRKNEGGCSKMLLDRHWGNRGLISKTNKRRKWEQEMWSRKARRKAGEEKEQNIRWAWPWPGHLGTTRAQRIGTLYRLWCWRTVVPIVIFFGTFGDKLAAVRWYKRPDPIYKTKHWLSSRILTTHEQDMRWPQPQQPTTLPWLSMVRDDCGVELDTL